MSSRFMNILFHHISICLFTELSLQCLLNFFCHERSPFKYSIFPDRKTSLCVKFSVICVDTKKYRSIRLPQLTTVLTLWLNLLLNMQSKMCAASELQTLLLRYNIAILCIDKKNLDRVLLNQVSPTHLLHQQQPEARRSSQWSGN